MQVSKQTSFAAFDAAKIKKRQIGAIAKAINTHGFKQALRMCNMENGKLLSPFIVQLCTVLSRDTIKSFRFHG